MAETQTDWRTLTAGRDLDVLLAERVFNGSPICIEGAWKWRRNGEGSFFTLPHFSGLPGAAWEVAEAMDARGFTLVLYRLRARNTWKAEFSSACCQEADTGPLAICRAALAALEVAP